MIWVALLFTLCGAEAEREDAPPESCESGIVRAVTCARAEAHIRGALRPGQVLHLHRCLVNPPPMAQLQGEP